MLSSKTLDWLLKKKGVTVAFAYSPEFGALKPTYYLDVEKDIISKEDSDEILSVLQEEGWTFTHFTAEDEKVILAFNKEVEEA
jgi:hypothetical protein